MVDKVAVMGSGSWGTTYSQMCCDAGKPTILWARRQEVADEINETGRNEGYLPGIDLPESLQATADADEALADADLVVLAIPSVYVESQLEEWGDRTPADATLASLVKGMDETLRTGSQIVTETLDCDPDRVVVVSGPNIARELAERLPAATVAACPDQRRARDVLAATMTSYFRVYTNPDKIGCETGGAVKNVIALAAGMGDGMGFGMNTKATLVTRGLAEITRLGVALGGQPLTFLGLAGVGDLVVTCASPNSRNRTVGERLGGGEELDDIIEGMSMVAEGVKSSKAIVTLARKAEVEMPISEAVVEVVHEGMDPGEAMTMLMSREAKSELQGLPETEVVAR